MTIKPKDIGCKVPYCQEAGTLRCQCCPANPREMLKKYTDKDLVEELNRRRA